MSIDADLRRLVADMRAAHAELVRVSNEADQAARRIAAELAEHELAMANFTRAFAAAQPDLRAAAVLIDAVPALGDWPTRAVLRLVRSMVRARAQMQGARTGSRIAATRRAMTDAKREVWQRLVSVDGIKPTIADRLVAQTFRVSIDRIRNLRAEARRRGEPWQGDER